MEEASSYYNISKEKIEESIFSDLLEEQILISFKPPSPLNVIKKYNLSSMQTLLFNALELSFFVKGNYQEIFRQINYLGLMYEIEKDEIKVTGPASLFKKTKKYGSSLARLLTSIIKAENWKITAKIETISGNEPKIYNFELSSSDDVLLPINNKKIMPFDSEVEAQFYRDFKTFNLGWEIKREPTFIKAGNYVIIPDFGFYKYGMEYYLEVVGFWTPEYLKKKILKLNNAEINIIVAVNKNLNCKKEDFPGNVIFYKNRIPIKPIIKILKESEEKYIQEELAKIQTVEMKEEIVSIKEKAKELNVNPEVLKQIKITNYYIIGDKIVSQKFLLKLKEKIGDMRNYNKVIKIVKNFGLELRALDYIGFKVVWKGLIPIKITSTSKSRIFKE